MGEEPLVNSLWILDEEGTPIQAKTIGEWARWFDRTDRGVAVTELGDVSVSTAFIGSSFVMWETAVFKAGEFSGIASRYSTKAQAEEGHWEVVESVLDKMSDGEILGDCDGEETGG